MSDSDSDSLGEIPLCDAPPPPKKAKIEVATSNHSLESSVAKREAAARAKAEAEDAERWLECEEWRCHFHVPVDLEAVGGLGTTRAAMDATLDAALAEPDRWGDRELHLELETYTWSVLPDGARGAGALVDGIEREYRHALERLALRGWRPATPTAITP